MSYKILIVDDEVANLRLLERLFRSEYNVITAASGAEAIELLHLHDVALIISDQRMPEMTGIEFLKRSAEIRPHTVRIILTGYTDVNSLVEAINSGVVYKYVTKPWANEDLELTVIRALQHYETLRNQHELRLQNERLNARLKASCESFVRLLIEMLSLKDPNSAARIHRIKDYAVSIGQCLDLKEQELEQLSLAVVLQESARIYIPDHLLRKKGTLTDEERRILIDSLERGLKMLASVPDFEDVVSTVRYQYENYDGSGHPTGLTGEQIPLYTRVIAVAEAFDEMTAPRSFQIALTYDEAIERLESVAGKKFDPKIVNIFCELKATEDILVF
jgi:response regulator RpfG family c-di-GMP phosphodiesterase